MVDFQINIETEYIFETNKKNKNEKVPLSQ